MILRLVFVLVIVGLAYLAVAGLERRRSSGQRLGLPPGVTVVTGVGCRLCAPVLAALRARGVAATVVDVDHHLPAVRSVRSLPTVYVVGEEGAVLLRRSGRAALVDAEAIAVAATGGGRSAAPTARRWLPRR